MLFGLCRTSQSLTRGQVMTFAHARLVALAGCALLAASGRTAAQQPLAAFHSAKAEEVALSRPTPAAVKYVEQIMGRIGLPMRFDIYAANVGNAQAEIRNGKRAILYNPSWMLELVTSAQTNWVMIQTLAHEVGHHLSFHEGYTSDVRRNREQELEADYFSGFILARLGATAEQATVADRILAAADSDTHPDSARRIEEITRGWNDATGRITTAAAPPPSLLPEGVKGSTIAGAKDSPSKPRRTVWDHNGSEMHLIGEGTTRRFVYLKPRESISAAGARAGTLLFAGERNGIVYRGISHVFSNRCGKLYYEVAGRVESGDVRVVLTGKAPAGLDATCKVTSSKDDMLVFTYLRTE